MERVRVPVDSEAGGVRVQRHDVTGRGSGALDRLVANPGVRGQSFLSTPGPWCTVQYAFSPLDSQFLGFQSPRATLPAYNQLPGDTPTVGRCTAI